MKAEAHDHRVVIRLTRVGCVEGTIVVVIEIDLILRLQLKWHSSRLYVELTRTQASGDWGQSMVVRWSSL